VTLGHESIRTSARVTDSGLFFWTKPSSENRLRLIAGCRQVDSDVIHFGLVAQTAERLVEAQEVRIRSPSKPLRYVLISSSDPYSSVYREKLETKAKKIGSCGPVAQVRLITELCQVRFLELPLEKIEN
jgi:hypothetical protein